MSPRPRSSAAGYTLVEVIIALAILLIGLVGFMKLQVFGATSTNGGRMHSVASELAREVVTGIERLQFNTPALTETGSSGPTPPDGFGRLAGVNPLPTGTHTFADGDIPGVRSNDDAQPFQRRWTVWSWAPTAGGAPSVKLVAVSVIWTEPQSQIQREVVAYTQLSDSAAFSLNITANE